MKTLHLNLEGRYFDQIKSGEKTHEYRLMNGYWKNRLFGKNGSRKEFDNILIKRGYPKKGDQRNIIERPWRGWEPEEITHEKFGENPVKVFAIMVN